MVSVWSMSVTAWQSILMSKFLRSMQSVVFRLPGTAYQSACSMEIVCHIVASNTCVNRSAQRAVCDFWLHRCIPVSASELTCSMEYVCVCVTALHSLLVSTLSAQRAVSGLWHYCFGLAVRMQYGVCLAQRGIQHLWRARRAVSGFWQSACGMEYVYHSVAFNTCTHHICAACSQEILVFLLKRGSRLAVSNMFVTAWHSTFVPTYDISAERAVRVSWLSCYSLAANLYY